ncbi:MAG: OmpA family protein [Lentisphaerales bacterium]|nr:OmpA family protein [Lentisphaerales bacterium]
MNKFKILVVFLSLALFTGCQSTSTTGGGSGATSETAVNGTSENLQLSVDDNTIRINPNDTIDGEFGRGLLPNEFVNGEKINHNFLPVHFSYDSARIEQGENRKLKMLAGFLESNSNLFLIVEGYCDERGSEEYNRALSERRGLAVKDFLESVAPSITARINTVGYGEERPVDTATNQEAYAKNRRAEFIIISKR